MYAAVKDFPADLRSSAFIELVRAFDKSKNGQTSRDSKSDFQRADGLPKSVTSNQKTVRSFDKDLEWYADNCDLDALNDMQFGAFLAFYWSELVPVGKRLDAIDEHDFNAACDAIGRHRPARARQALNDAKRKKNYLLSSGDKKFKITRKGKNFVRNDVLKGKT